jgi:hypothetical protein
VSKGSFRGSKIYEPGLCSVAPENHDLSLSSAENSKEKPDNVSFNKTNQVLFSILVLVSLSSYYKPGVQGSQNEYFTFNLVDSHFKKEVNALIEEFQPHKLSEKKKA